MSDSPMVLAVARELAQSPDFELTLSGVQLLQIVSFLQIAMRHPGFANEPEAATQFVREFIETAREGFEGCPAVQMVIDKNNDGCEVRAALLC